MTTEASTANVDHIPSFIDGIPAETVADITDVFMRFKENNCEDVSKKWPRQMLLELSYEVTDAEVEMAIEYFSASSTGTFGLTDFIHMIMDEGMHEQSEVNSDERQLETMSFLAETADSLERLAPDGEMETIAPDSEANEVDSEEKSRNDNRSVQDFDEKVEIEMGQRRAENLVEQGQIRDRGAVLTAAMLAAAPPSRQKTMIGERLQPLVWKFCPERAEEATRLLLGKEDNCKLLGLIESEAKSKAKLDEVLSAAAWAAQGGNAVNAAEANLGHRDQRGNGA